MRCLLGLAPVAAQIDWLFEQAHTAPECIARYKTIGTNYGHKTIENTGTDED